MEYFSMLSCIFILVVMNDISKIKKSIGSIEKKSEEK